MTEPSLTVGEIYKIINKECENNGCQPICCPDKNCPLLKFSELIENEVGE